MLRWSSLKLRCPQLSLFLANERRHTAGFLCRLADWPCGRSSLWSMLLSPIVHTTHPVLLLFKHTIRYHSKPGNTFVSAVIFFSTSIQTWKILNPSSALLKIQIVSKTLKTIFVGYENRNMFLFFFTREMRLERVRVRETLTASFCCSTGRSSLL